MMLFFIIKCKIFQHIRKNKITSFFWIFGNFTNITNIECGSDGTNKIFDHHVSGKNLLYDIGPTSLKETTQLSKFVFL